ncbi:hypothetical protein TNCV_1839721 [Trichonephila clavipes]|nr:hypothetical protein TNCV_1839721 [Trichonephila clavipes]
MFGDDSKTHHSLHPREDRKLSRQDQDLPSASPLSVITRNIMNYLYNLIIKATVLTLKERLTIYFSDYSSRYFNLHRFLNELKNNQDSQDLRFFLLKNSDHSLLNHQC